MSDTMNGRVVLITGGTSGIGKATALGLAALHATVIIVGRDEARSKATVAEIKAATHNDQVSYMLADLASLESVRRLASQFKAHHAQVHVLINNAGVIHTTRTTTIDGYETTLAVNFLAPFLLTNLLLDPLKDNAPARIVNLSSDSHERAKIDFDDLQSSKHFGAFEAYGRSNLARILFTYELARRLAGSGITANCLHPGAVGTNMGYNNKGILITLFKLARPFMRKPEQGAETSIYLASSPEITDTSGKYFVDCKPIRSSAVSYSEADAQRLWRVGAELTGLAPA